MSHRDKFLHDHRNTWATKAKEGQQMPDLTVWLWVCSLLSLFETHYDTWEREMMGGSQGAWYPRVSQQ